MNRVGLALGSNLGNKAGLISMARDACRCWNAAGEPFLQSSLYATAPVGCPDGSDDYLNAVVELSWEGTPEELLEATQKEELRLGRVRSGVRCEPRTVDIDILYIDGVNVETDWLTVPHPRLHQRKFVLKPLNDIRPELIVHGQRATVAELLGLLESPEPEPVLYSKEW